MVELVHGPNRLRSESKIISWLIFREETKTGYANLHEFSGDRHFYTGDHTVLYFEPDENLFIYGIPAFHARRWSCR